MLPADQSEKKERERENEGKGSLINERGVKEMRMSRDLLGHQRRPHEYELRNSDDTGIAKNLQEKVLDETATMASARRVSNVHHVFETEVVSGTRGRQTLTDIRNDL